MTERERLICLIKQAEKEFSDTGKPILDIEEYVADYLLSNGVIVPPVSLGEKIYEIISPKCRNPYFITAIVCAVHIADGSRNSCQRKRESYIVAECQGTKYVHKYPFSKFGKTLFLTREEAEKALEEREEK